MTFKVFGRRPLARVFVCFSMSGLGRREPRTPQTKQKKSTILFGRNASTGVRLLIIFDRKHPILLHARMLTLTRTLSEYSPQRLLA